jgi:predicted AlkP superfamily pyrophosphatase or phosphodiesterase
MYSTAKLLIGTAQFLIQDVPHAFNNALDSYQVVARTPRWTGQEKAKHVIFINLDAISPEQFEEIRASSPMINEAVSSGAISSRMLGTFPAQTSTMHASTLTGEYPERHGIYTVFEQSLDDILFVDQCSVTSNAAVNNRVDCKSKKLTDAAFRRGLTTGSFGFCTTHQDPHISYNIGDMTCTRDAGIAGGIFKKMSTVFALKHMIPAMIRQTLLAPSTYTSPEMIVRLLDDGYVSAAEDVILNHRAHFVCVQQVGYDLASHCFGTRSPQAGSTLVRYTEHLERLIRASRMAGTYEDTVFSLMSDHLIFDIDRYVYLNNLFWRNGLISVAGRKVISCSAYGESVGKSFLIHIADKKRSTKSRVMELLQQNQDAFGIERILDWSELDSLHAGTQYDLACTAVPGVMFVHNLNLSGDIKRDRKIYFKAQHGQDPRGNLTTFAIWGPGIKRGYESGDMNGVDIAPTLVHVLGLDFHCSGGKVLDVFEE